MGRNIALLLDTVCKMRFVKDLLVFSKREESIFSRSNTTGGTSFSFCKMQLNGRRFKGFMQHASLCVKEGSSF